MPRDGLGLGAVIARVATGLSEQNPILGGARIGRDEMARRMGGWIAGIGYAVWLAVVLWSFALCLAKIAAAGGFWAAAVAYLGAPVTFVAAPWYAALAWGDWLPLGVGYGGGLVAASVVLLGSSLTRGGWHPQSTT